MFYTYIYIYLKYFVDIYIISVSCNLKDKIFNSVYGFRSPWADSQEGTSWQKTVVEEAVSIIVPGKYGTVEQHLETKGPGTRCSTRGHPSKLPQTHTEVCFTNLLGSSQGNQVESQD